MDEKRFRQQLAFSLELDKEKNIFRQTHLSGYGRNENDAEHAWHMAIMAYLLREYANTELDITRTMLMILIHDVVEIDAGDTYAYDPKGKETQKERELQAADRLFGMLPEDQAAEFRALWDEFEEYETPESRFAHTMDNFQPMLLNNSNNGTDWVAHGIARPQVEKRNEKTAAGSEAIWEYMKTVIDKHVEAGTLKQAETKE